MSAPGMEMMQETSPDELSFRAERSGVEEPAVSQRASKWLAQEFWVSFTSLLRSHVAMRAMARPALGLLAHMIYETEIVIESSCGSLRVNAGGIIDMDRSSQTFFFTEDGLVAFGETHLEMEAAVERLLDEVCR